MTTTLTIERVYVDLDCLLDTRLGCIAQYRDTLAAEIISNGQYHARQKDEFPGLSYEAFKTLYAARNVETLKVSMLTNAFDFLRLITDAHLKTCHERNEDFHMEFVINTFPYELSDEEKEEIGKVVYLQLAELVPVKVERLADGFLTPKYCKETYTVMVRYSWEQWLECQSENFKTTQMPGVTFFAPALYYNTPTAEDFAELERMNVKPFQLSEKAFAPLFGLRLIDARVFSIIDLPKPSSVKTA